MGWTFRRSDLIFGALFGAWLGGVFAVVSRAVNWLSLPGVPLAQPDGSLESYLGRYILFGALLGLVSTMPDDRYVGMALGGFTAAVISGLQALVTDWGYEAFSSTLVTVLLTFLPLVVLMMPLALLIRLGVDAQHIDPGRPYLWARRYTIPLLVSLIAVLAGSFSLYSPQARSAFRYMDALVQQGLRAGSSAKLPEPLQTVSGFSQNARGPYAFLWSDRLDTYFGPRPAESELSQFMIITRFENGFAFACIFSDNRSVPSCTNY